MRFSLGYTIVCLALSNVAALAIPSRSLPMVSDFESKTRQRSSALAVLKLSLEEFESSHIVQDSLSSHSYHLNNDRREVQKQQGGSGGGLQIGGLTLGGPG